VYTSLAFVLYIYSAREELLRGRTKIWDAFHDDMGMRFRRTRYIPRLVTHEVLK
jgi:hypothetical protein